MGPHKRKKAPKLHVTRDKDGLMFADGVHVVSTKKKAEDETPDFQPLEVNSTSARPIDLSGSRLENEFTRASDAQSRLQQETTDPETGEFVGTPEQAEKTEMLDNEIGGLSKMIRQVKYNIRDTLTHGQAKALSRDGESLDNPVRPEKAASSQTKVSPHGFESVFGETNRATNPSTDEPKPMNLAATLGLNSQAGRTTGRVPDSQPLSNPSYTGPGAISNRTPMSVEKVAFLGKLLELIQGIAKPDPMRTATGKRLEANMPVLEKMRQARTKSQPQLQKQLFETRTAAEKTMDVYEKRAAEVLGRGSMLIDPKEIRVTFFFDGLADGLEKAGFYVEKPTEFFVGLYENMREHFEGSAKLASGVYLPHVVNACNLFADRMLKAADMSQLQAVNPLDAADQAQENALGVSPQRQEKRQDIIDAMLPHAETISLDPDGKIKLKMPSPEAAGIMDPGMLQQQRQAEMQGRGQAEQANQMPLPTGEEAPAPMEGGQAAPQGEISPESLAASEQAMAAAGGGNPGGEEMPGAEEMLGAEGMPGAEPAGETPMQGAEGISGENELIQALMAQMKGSPGMAVG